MGRQTKHLMYARFHYAWNYASATVNGQSHDSVRRSTVLAEVRKCPATRRQHLAAMTKSRFEIQARRLGKRMASLSGAGIAMGTLIRLVGLEGVDTKAAQVNRGVATMTSVVGQLQGITTEHWKASVMLDAMRDRVTDRTTALTFIPIGLVVPVRLHALIILASYSSLQKVLLLTPVLPPAAHNHSEYVRQVQHDEEGRLPSIYPPVIKNEK